MVTSLPVLAKSLLCPPGNGVFTIHTAQERKNELHQRLFKTSAPAEVEKAWLKSLTALDGKLPILLGLASDCGGGIQRGANWGPLFLRLELIEAQRTFGTQFFDAGDVRVIPHLLHDRYVSKETLSSCRKALYGSARKILPVSPLSMAEAFLDALYHRHPHAKVFGLGGDHSVSYAFTKSFFKKQKKLKRKTGILHFDAHTDLLDHRLGIDICFGSWAYHARQWCASPSALVQVGIRSSGKSQEHWERTLKVKQFWSKEVREEGAAKIAQKIITHYKKIGIEDLYLSFDIDALDSRFAGATGTPEPAGLFPHEAAVIIGEVARHFQIAGADLTEVAPFVKSSEVISLEPTTTLLYAKLIANLILEKMSASWP
ncbi:MAG: arginase [Bdellovibrionales bacterium GWA2_49_15]|nr:MAG: arginase [Bdellovibrionales bacterium GWA2_49_15]HAZ14287.1 arginase [Bdellovibrionales bacterium]